MDDIFTTKLIFIYLIEGFINVFKIAWETDIVKSAIVGIPISILTFWIVRLIFSWGKYNGIWFGRLGGKLLYYLINSFLVWLVIKAV